MMKTNIAPTFETHKYVRAAHELAAAQAYIFNDPIAVIGRSNFDAHLFKRLKMPALPLLMSNREQRAALHKPWFGKRCFASAIVKCKDAINTFKHAIEQEKQKQMHAFNWKQMLQDPMPHESVDKTPMMYKDFKMWCNQM